MAVRQKLAILLGLAASGLFLWLALHDADFATIGTTIATANPAMILPFLGCLFVFYWLKSSRWSLLLSPAAKLRTAELFPVVMIGYAGTAILPMQLGELVRTYIAARRHALPISLVLASIGVERVFDLLTILALLAVVLATGQAMPDALTKAGYAIAAVTIFALAVAAFFVLRQAQAFRLANSILRPLPDRIRHAVMSQVEVATRGLQSLARPRLVAQIAWNSLLQWGLMGLCIWLSLIAVAVEVPISAAALVLVATIIGISLPTGPGYIGNIQLAFVIALQPFGIPAAQAIAASVFYHVLAYISVLLAGAYCARRLGLGTAEIRKSAQQSTLDTK